MSKKYLLFDVGGTNTRLAMLKGGSKLFGKPVIIKTPKNFNDAIKVFKTQAHNLCGSEISGAAGGIPAVMNSSKSILVKVPNLPNWDKKPFKKTLEKIIKAPVVIDNDTAVVGLGEALYGAGRGYDLVAYITISTGVNGVRIDHGKIDSSAQGFEIGKQIIDEEGRTLEWHISGRFIKKRFGKNPHDLKDKKFWSQAHKHLAVGLKNTIVYWSPHVVVLGGGVVTNEMNLVKVVKELKKILKIYPKLPIIKRSKFKDFGGLYGAMALIRQGKKHND